MRTAGCRCESGRDTPGARAPRRRAPGASQLRSHSFPVSPVGAGRSEVSSRTSVGALRRRGPAISVVLRRRERGLRPRSSQIENDGETVIGRPRSDGRTPHGTECKELLGTITSGKSSTAGISGSARARSRASAEACAFARTAARCAAVVLPVASPRSAKCSHSFSSVTAARGPRSCNVDRPRHDGDGENPSVGLDELDERVTRERIRTVRPRESNPSRSRSRSRRAPSVLADRCLDLGLLRCRAVARRALHLSRPALRRNAS